MKQRTHSLKTLSLGGGVQSSTITEMIIEGFLEPIDAIIFADTGDEPQYVYDHVQYLRGRLTKVNIPLIVVNNGNLLNDLYSGKRFVALPLLTKQLIPINDKASRVQVGRLQRQCTKEYKIFPIERWIKQELLRRELAKRDKRGAIRINKGVSVETWLGISLDEVGRMKPSRTRWIDNRWPLIDLRMSRADCIRWLQDRGLPVPNKSSCRICPYHTIPYWRETRDTRPGDWIQVTGFDSDLRNGNLRLSATAKGEVFLARDCIPLIELDLSTSQENGQMSLDICDEGYCGPFI